MSYLLDYVDSQFSSFEELPFNPVDAAAFSQLTMIRAGAVVPSLLKSATFTDEETALESELNPDTTLVSLAAMLKEEHFSDMFGGSTDGDLLKENLFRMAVNPRYRDLTVGNYLSVFDMNREVQFAAVSFSYKDEWSALCYRGTDSTLTGWKEDCNMAFRAPVPAQTHALTYLETVAPRLNDHLIVIGHSKGGNLAEYAVTKACAHVQKRIVRVFNLDGPGFKKDVISSSEYAPIIDRIEKVCPRDSIVGILLYSPVPVHVVPSNATGAGEHNPFTWEVNSANDDFVYLPKLSENSLLLQTILRQWLTQYDDDKRERLVESIFAVIQKSGGKNINDVFGAGLSGSLEALENVSATDSGDVSTIVEAGQNLMNVAANYLENKLRSQQKDA